MRFFVDEDLDGESFVRPLRLACVDLVRHRELFAKGAADTVWIPVAAASSWIVLSANTTMRFVPIEVEAIQRHGARVLYLRQGKATTHPRLASLLVRSMPVVERFFASGIVPRVGVLRRLPDTRDPLDTKAGSIEVPMAFR